MGTSFGSDRKEAGDHHGSGRYRFIRESIVGTNRSRSLNPYLFSADNLSILLVVTAASLQHSG